MTDPKSTALGGYDISAIPVSPVILCGGSGARLWPLSRSSFPKQFLVLSDDDSNQSLFQQAVERVNALGNGNREYSNIEVGKTVIVANEEHRFLVLDQLRELKNIQTTLLLEPVGRNTAPALTMAAMYSSEYGADSKQNVMDGAFDEVRDPILVVTPADQTIQNDEIFTKALQACVHVVAADKDKKTVAILGITPTSPEIGYGYIKRSGGPGTCGEFDVEQFAEKPDAKTAQIYFDSGNYFWNSGMFVLRASTWLKSLKEFRSDIFVATKASWDAKTSDQSGDVQFIRPDKEFFKSIPSESIDYAVIEKCPSSDQASSFNIKMVELNAGWNDLGAWDAVWQAGKKDGSGNVTSGDTLLSNTKNSIVHASTRLVGSVGVSNLVIVETADAVLVADRANSQEVKLIVKQLESQQREEKNLHRKVARPWGWYDSLDQGERFKVKRISVNPGASLSLQMHHHRAEHWVVVKGIAEITNGDKVITLNENQSTYIPQGQRHRLSNPGDDQLEIIEVQSGNYLGEDDIVRFEDSYGRS